MTIDSTTIAVREAHSKLILVGEHGVVYGKPAIAIPFPLKAKATIEQVDGPIMVQSDIFTGPIYNMPLKMKGILNCIKETLHYLRQPFEGLRIKIDSAIPLGRGLGSSAAVPIAIVKSLFFYYGQELSQEVLFSLVHNAEIYAHGNPSGIDMVAASSDGPIWFEKGKDIASIKPHGPWYIVVGDSGRIGDTRRAVENVRKRYILEPERIKKSLDKIEKIADNAKRALIDGDMYLLGELLSSNHNELINLGVSDDGLNLLVKRALDAEALGSKLTGGGLGGCMIALASSLDHAKEISNELMKAGASKSWYFSTMGDTLYTAHK